jgi:single-strand DNA-binding protein
MNKAILLGRLTRDPEVRYTSTGKVVCSFTIAVDRTFTNADGQREADFIPVVVWGKAAELCGNSLAKGHRILVEGRIQTRSYETKEGQKRYVTEVIASNVEFIERKSESANRGLKPTSGAPAGGASAPKAEGQEKKSGMETFGASVPFDEEVPF